VQGINRVYWDLRFDPMSPNVAPPRPATGPTPPAGPEEGPVQGPVPEATPGARPAGPPPRVNILAPPGIYLVKLNVGGQQYSQALTVLLDPGSAGHLREIELQTAMLKELAADLKSSLALTEGIQDIRRQLKAYDQTNTGTRSQDLMAAAALERKFSALEDKLRQQKPVAFYEWPVQLSAKFVYLAGHLQSSDREPTIQARAAYTFLKNELHLAQKEYDRLVAQDLAAFNETLRKQGLKEIASKE
jgi:hypothetical protein